MTPSASDRLERQLGDFRAEVAREMGRVGAQLEAMKGYDDRLRHLEQNAVTREELKDVLKEAIETGRRISWKDLGILVTTTAAAASAVAAIIARLAS